MSLADAVRFGNSSTPRRFPTPTARDCKAGVDGYRAARREGTPPLSDAIGGQLSPTWVEWLMGYPLGWSVCALSATRGSRKRRSQPSG